MELNQLTSICSALGHPARAKIFFTLWDAPEAQTLGVLAAIFNMPESTCSHHVKVLEQADLIIRAPAGKFTLFVANRHTLFELGNFFIALIQGTQNEPTGSTDENTTKDPTLRQSGNMENEPRNELGEPNGGN